MIILRSFSDVDEHAVRDLVLWLENTRELWQRAEALIVNLSKKKAKGVEPDRLKLRNSSFIDGLIRDTLKSYNHEYSEPDERIMLDRATREKVRDEFADVILSRVDEY